MKKTYYHFNLPLCPKTFLKFISDSFTSETEDHDLVIVEKKVYGCEGDDGGEDDSVVEDKVLDNRSEQVLKSMEELTVASV